MRAVARAAQRYKPTCCTLVATADNCRTGLRHRTTKTLCNRFVNIDATIIHKEPTFHSFNRQGLLESFLSLADVIGRPARWRLSLPKFDFDNVRIAGNSQQTTEALF